MKKGVVCVLFAGIISLCAAQTAGSTSSAAVDGDAQTRVPVSENAPAAPDVRTDESLIRLTPETPEAAVVQQQTGTGWLLFRMILVLALIVAGMYAFFFVIRRSARTPYSSNPYLRNTASLSLGAGKAVHVITLDSHAYLVGATDASVNLLAEISDKELIDAMNLNADTQPAGKPKDFASLLAAFLPFKHDGENQPQNVAATADELRRQQERLRNLNGRDSQ